VRRPRLLLLDEPLSALDSVLREGLRWELRRVLEDCGIPVVLVTHDRVEAIALADEVAVVKDGAILETGPVHEVFTRPGDLSVARIVGVETVVPARVLRVDEGLATVQVGGVELVAVPPEHLEGDAYACIRAEDVLLQRSVTGTASARNQLRARITTITPEGPMVRVGLDCGFSLTALVTRPAREELGLRTGEWVFALLKAPAVHLVARGRRA
jgi:molybdate transport system ATP-binding protein